MIENRLPIVDRLVEFDERSRNYRAVEGLEDKPFRSYTWSCDVYNDQGYEGACVGYAWSHELSARPAVYRVDDNFAKAIYYRARHLDPWPGEDYDGTSVLAGIKAVMEVLNERNLPLYGEYRWGFGIQDVLRMIGYSGPVVLGINWYMDMYYPDRETGFITPSGELAGGHAILANGIKVVKKDPFLPYPVTWDNLDLDKSHVRLHNSWGTSYGMGGDAFVTVRDLAALLHDDGEACIPTLRRK